MTIKRLSLLILFLCLVAYIAWVVDLVGTGLDGWITGWGLPVALLLMLVIALVLPAFEAKMDGPGAKSLIKDVGLLLKIFIIGGTLGSLAQHLVWRRSYHLKDFFTGPGWPLVFLILLVATVAVVAIVGRLGRQRMGLVAATFAFFSASSIFTFYSAVYAIIMLSDTTADCLHHTRDIAAQDSCILEHGTGADCDLIQSEDIRGQCYLKHGRSLD